MTKPLNAVQMSSLSRSRYFSDYRTLEHILVKIGIIISNEHLKMTTKAELQKNIK